MDDRTLLEKAAKAAASVGMEIIDTEAGPQILECRRATFESYRLWRPNHDDGDAARLANALGLAVIPYPIYEQPKHSVICKQYENLSVIRESCAIEVVELYGEDKDAATRRAIVRAAAAMADKGE